MGKLDKPNNGYAFDFLLLSSLKTVKYCVLDKSSE